VEDGARLYAALEPAITYLACHARRAQPGLEPFFEMADMIEFAAAA